MLTPEEIEAAHDRMDRECDEAMARDKVNESAIDYFISERDGRADRSGQTER
jgi:hypothetical protein